MNSRELAQEALERAAKATNGPWEFTENDRIKAWLEPPEDVPGYHGIAETIYARDKEFIAHAREDVPTLAVALLEALEENERLTESNLKFPELLDIQQQQIEELEQKVKAKQAAIDLQMQNKMVSKKRDDVTGGGREFPVCMTCNRLVVKAESAQELYEIRVADADKVEELEGALRKAYTAMRSSNAAQAEVTLHAALGKPSVGTTQEGDDK